MVNPTWPASLPDHLEAGSYRESPPDLTIRTNMEVGPPAVRRRSTAGVRPIQGTLAALTPAQVATLDDFYANTLASGAIRFDWVNPRTQAAVTMRMTDPPEYRARQAARGTRYDAALKLEVLP